MRTVLLMFVVAVAFGQMPPGVGVESSTKICIETNTPTRTTWSEYDSGSHSCVPYLDETGQKVGVLVKRQAAKAKVASSPQTTTPLSAIKRYSATTSAAAPLRFMPYDPKRDPYLTVFANKDYSPRSLTVRIDGSNVTLSWSEFEQVIHDRKKALAEQEWQRNGSTDLTVDGLDLQQIRWRSSTPTRLSPKDIIWTKDKEAALQPYCSDGNSVWPADKDGGNCTNPVLQEKGKQ